MSTAQHVLSTSELLHCIILHADKGDNIRSNLTVCKSWASHVLDVAWYEVDDLKRLFRLLSPMQVARKSRNMRFQRLLTPGDWETFDKYAVRVKSLKLLPCVEDLSNVFTAVSMNRIRHELLPNLRSITCHLDDTSILNLFLHSNVTTLQLVNLNVLESIAMICLYLPVKVPKLQELSISSSIVLNGSSNKHISASVASLVHLKSITLPSTWYTPTLTRSLSTLQDLSTISSPRASSGSFTTFFDESEAGNDQRCFPSLTSLTLTVPFAHATACLTGKLWPASLKQLTLFSSEVESLESSTTLIIAISNVCPYVEELTLEARKLKTESTMKMHDLEAVLSCQSLKSLRVDYSCLTSLTSSDILHTLDALPCLSKLYLNQNASFPNLHISCLSAIARQYPSRLDELGLSFDCSSDRLPKYDEEVCLTHLQRLSVGSSRLGWQSDPIQVATYLSRVLRGTCVVTHGTESGTGPSREGWGLVTSVVPALANALHDGERRANKRL